MKQKNLNWKFASEASFDFSAFFLPRNSLKFQQTPLKPYSKSLFKQAKKTLLSTLPNKRSKPSLEAKQLDVFFLLAGDALYQKESNYLSFHEAVFLIQKSPTFTCFEELHSDQEKKIIVVYTFIEPVPGITYEIKAYFEKDREATVPVKPLKGSCSIEQRSSPSSFPHPLQRAGMAFPNELLPLLKKNISTSISMDFFQSYTSSRNRFFIDQQLQIQSKETWKRQKELFYQKKDDVLQLHQKIIRYLLGLEHSPPFIQQLYEWLNKKEHSLFHLSKLMQLVSKEYLITPFHRFIQNYSKVNRQKDIKKKIHTSNLKVMFSLELLARKQRLIQHLSIMSYPSCSLFFSELLGKKLHELSLNIILNVMSNSHQLPHILLSQRSQNFLILLFKQELDFQQSIEESFCEKDPCRLLLEDLHILHGDYSCHNATKAKILCLDLELLIEKKELK